MLYDVEALGRDRETMAEVFLTWGGGLTTFTV